MPAIRVNSRGPEIDEQLLDRFRQTCSSAVSDCLEFNAATVGLLPVGGSLESLAHPAVAGPALTVRTRPGDNLALHKALDLAQPGDILMIDARGDLFSSILGEIITTYARSRLLGALVVDGAIRDSAAISAGDLPVYSRGISPIGPTRVGPGEVHGEVSVGGVVVHDGDLVVGDHDGLAVVPRERLDVIGAVEALLRKEAASLAAIAEGTWDRSWVGQSAD